jgi:hypothetical protein
MLHTKGTRGWMRALVIVMVSLSLTLSMPAKPAMALITVPTIDVQGVPLWIKQLAEQVATKLINMAMQKLMEEANKRLGPVVNMPILGEILQPTLDGISQDLTGMLTRGSNDLMGNIFRSPQQNFQDCMNNIACTSNIQLGNNFTASFSGDNPFKVTTPSALPVALKNSLNFGDVAGVAVEEMAFPGPATSVSPGVWEAVTTGGDKLRFAYSGSTPPLAIAAGTAFTTSDAAVSPDFLKTMNLDVGNGALKFSNVALDGGNPYTMTASPSVRTAIEQANKTGVPQNVAGMTIEPGLGVGSNGQITGNIAAALNFGGAPIGATFGANGVSNLSVGDLSKTLCPNLTDADKLGGKVCGAANAAVSGLLGCISGGNAGNCAQDVGKNAAQQLLGGIGQALGGALKGGSSSSGLQVQAAEQALLAQNFLPPNNNTAESITKLTADRNAALAYAATSYIANAKLWQIKFPQIKADCDKAVKKATKNGDSNSLQAGKIIQIECYNAIDGVFENLRLERSIVDMYSIIVTAPTAIPPKG